MCELIVGEGSTMVTLSEPAMCVILLLCDVCVAVTVALYYVMCVAH